MAKKKYRELTVGEYGGYGRRVSPMIRLNGLWLEEAGFHAGDPVLVRCEDGKLIIMQDRAKAEMLERDAVHHASFREKAVVLPNLCACA